MLEGLTVAAGQIYTLFGAAIEAAGKGGSSSKAGKKGWWGGRGREEGREGDRTQVGPTCKVSSSSKAGKDGEWEWVVVDGRG